LIPGLNCPRLRALSGAEWEHLPSLTAENCDAPARLNEASGMEISKHGSWYWLCSLRARLVGLREAWNPAIVVL